MGSRRTTTRGAGRGTTTIGMEDEVALSVFYGRVEVAGDLTEEAVKERKRKREGRGGKEEAGSRQLCWRAAW